MTHFRHVAALLLAMTGLAFVQPAVALSTPVFPGLERFNGKAPWDLVQDDTVGKEIRRIVPQAHYKCMDDDFNYMQDLSLRSDGAVQSTALGSHADNFVKSYIAVTPNGGVTIALQCDPGSTAASDRYYVFTNEASVARPSAALTAWLDTVGGVADRVTVFAGAEKKEMSLQAYVGARASATPAPSRASPPSAVAGTAPPSSSSPEVKNNTASTIEYIDRAVTICASPGSMYKVHIAEDIARNPYVKRPNDCIFTPQALVVDKRSPVNGYQGIARVLVRYDTDWSYVRVQDIKTR